MLGASSSSGATVHWLNRYDKRSKPHGHGRRKHKVIMVPLAPARVGDPFLYAASRRPDRDQESPHGCYDAWVYLGCEGEDENGEHVEEIERVPCRACPTAGVRTGSTS